MTDEAMASANEDAERLRGLLEQLTLEEKILLLTGRDFWTTQPMEKIGLRAVLVSDGPSGVRGEVWDERSPSLNLPSASALSSAWDPRSGASVRCSRRSRGPTQGRRCRSRPDNQPAPVTARRSSLRGVQ